MSSKMQRQKKADLSVAGGSPLETVELYTLEGVAIMGAINRLESGTLKFEVKFP